MAVENMRESYGQDSVTEEHVLTVFRNSLEAVSFCLSRAVGILSSKAVVKRLTEPKPTV